MIIKNITLYNYRLYKDKNEIIFNNKDDKNLFLISGENGFGKTTFLQSLLWCLYGKLIGDIEDSLKKDISNKGGYQSFLQNNLNHIARQDAEGISEEDKQRIRKNGYSQADDFIKSKAQYYVSIDFSEVFIPSIPCKSLKVIRSYDYILEKEFVEIFIDGSRNELATEIGPDVFINDFILSKDIARFFFFDSEKIVSLAETNTIEDRRTLCSAYNEVLGVKKYEDLKRNLENMRLRFRKQSNDFNNREQLQLYLDKQKALMTEEQSLSNSLNIVNADIEKAKKVNEEYQMKLLREGNGNSIEEFRRAEQVVDATRSKDIEYKQQLKQFLEYAPFAVAGSVFKEARQQTETDFGALQSKQNASNQKRLVSKIYADLLKVIHNQGLDENQQSNLELSIKDTLEKYKKDTNDIQTLLKFTKEEYEEFDSIFNNISTTYKIEFEHLADAYRKNRQTLDRNSRKLSQMQGKENDLLIKQLRQEKSAIEKQISDLESDIIQLTARKGIVSQELATTNKLIAEISKKINLADSDVKKDKIAEQLIGELSSFLVSLKNEKKYSLERRIKAVMNTLMHKEDFIHNVEVNVIDDTIDINLHSPDNQIIRKDSLSKGEQQLYATSILKALVDESGIQFPVFIDSPLQKFDKSHSNKIITEFYPTVSKQVVLFPLLYKELTKPELDIMKPLVNSSFLIKNDNSHSYFEKVDVDSLMTE